jgi:hypothetical protein
MSPLWKKITSLQLTTNMQLQSHPDFPDFLLNIGEGGTGMKVDIPDSMVATGNSIEGPYT